MGSERSMTSGSDRPGVSLGPPWPVPVSLGKSHNPWPMKCKTQP